MQAISPGQVLILECQPDVSIVLHHPPGDYHSMAEDGSVSLTPYRDMAQKAVLECSAGSRWTLPSIRDECGKSLWELREIPMQDRTSHEKVQKIVTQSLEGTGVNAVVLPACVKIAGVVG